MYQDDTMVHESDHDWQIRLLRREESDGWHVLSRESSWNAKVADPKQALPGPGPGLEVTHEIPPHYSL